MINAIPIWIRIILLAIIGGLVGQFINWAIYRFGATKTTVSPWSKPENDKLKRTWQDRLPIIGWLFLKRESSEFGKAHWVRPLAIEIFCVAALPWFYQWIAGGGMTDPTVPIPVVPTAGQADLWFFGLSILTALLMIATFIDFDQRLIPDWITVPGTIFALLLHAFFPNFRLPITTAGAGIGTFVTEPLHFATPNVMPTFHYGVWGMVAALAIFSIWIAALLPYVYLPNSPFWKRTKTVWGVMWRQTTRKSKLPVHSFFRQVIFVFLAIWIVGAAAIALSWFSLPAVNCDALFGSFAGMAIGGAIVWGIRIVAGIALGQEAMGFGDVTLMAMIGAFLGWQPALITFGIAPFAALLIVFVYFLITKDSYLAFGPYLALGAIIVFMFWGTVWPAVRFQFKFAIVLLAALAVSLLIMGPLLVLVRAIKEKALGIESSAEQFENGGKNGQ